MKIKQIINILKKYQIAGISDDTRYLSEGDLFICYEGNNYKGANFVIQAIKKGAKAILISENIPNCSIPVILVDNVKEIMYPLVAQFYQYPWKKLHLIGITGTDGKTTTATYTEYLLSQKYPVAYIGTNGIRYLNQHLETNYTTLPYCLFVKTLSMFVNHNIKYVCMEASSQGLVNNRLHNVKFDIAVFTNLTHEHLDTHITMENYFNAKYMLFKQIKTKGIGIINIDSPYAKKIKTKNITFGINNKASFRAINITFLDGKAKFDLLIKKKLIKNIYVNISEIYNIYNLLPAIIIALRNKITQNDIIKAITSLPKVDGRLQLISDNKPFKVYIDFAHTPNALKELLTSLKTKTSSRLIVVCGSAGHKDKSKRPLIGKVATSIADYVIFTSEDPRSENPEDIINQMISDVKTQNYEIIVDRTKAIAKAISIAEPNDIVIVTGKGNDNYFEINNHKYSYSDAEVIKNILAE